MRKTTGSPEPSPEDKRRMHFENQAFGGRMQSPKTHERNYSMKNVIDRQYAEDVHDLLDDISQPNQSMSMSNLSHISQSPFRGGNTTPGRNVPPLDIAMAVPVVGLASTQPEQEAEGMSLQLSQTASKLGAETARRMELGGTQNQICLGQLSMSNETGGFSQIEQPRHTRDVPDQQEPEQKNRTFADSVLLQGMMAEKRGAAHKQQEPTSPISNNAKDMSAFSNLTALTGNRMQFRMELPKTPQREAKKIESMKEEDPALRSEFEVPGEEPVKNDLDKSAISDISGLGKSPFVMKFNIPDDTSNIGRDSLPPAQLQPEVEPRPVSPAQIAPVPNKHGSGVEDFAAMRTDSEQDKKLRVELTLKAAELRKAALQIDELNKQLKQSFNLSSEKDKVINELEASVRALTDKVAVLEQSRENHAALPSFLTRQHDEARRVNQALKMQVQTLESHLAQLQIQKSSLPDEYLEKQSMMEQVKSLCQQVDAEKLLSSSLKTQMAALEKRLEDESSKLTAESGSQQKAFQAQIDEREAYISQIVKEYAEKEAELQAALKSVHETAAQIKQVQHENRLLTEQNSGLQQRAKVLERDLEGKAQPQAQSVDGEIRRLREQTQREVQVLKDENRRLKLSEERLKAEFSEEKRQEFLQLKARVTETDELLSRCTILAEVSEEDRLLKAVELAEESTILRGEYERLRTQLTDALEQKTDADAELVKARREVETLRRNKDAGPSAFTKSLLAEKDNQLDAMRTERDNSRKQVTEVEDKLWHAQKDAEVANIAKTEAERLLGEFDTRLTQLVQEKEALKAEADERSRNDQTDQANKYAELQQRYEELVQNRSLKAVLTTCILDGLQIDPEESELVKSFRNTQEQLSEQVCALKEALESKEASLAGSESDLQRQLQSKDRCLEIATLEIETMTQDLEKLQRSERALLDQLAKAPKGGQSDAEVQMSPETGDIAVQTGPDPLLENYAEQVVGLRELIEQLEFELSEARVKHETAEKAVAVLKADLEEAAERETALLDESSIKERDQDQKKATQVASLEDKIKRMQGDLDRESRQHREELERLAKQQQQLMSKVEADHKLELNAKDLDRQEAVDQLQAKHKKDQKLAAEKAQSQLRNAVDDARNDLARAQAEWDRERKRIANDAESRVQQAQDGKDDDVEERLRAFKEKAEKQAKKRLLERENEMQERLDQMSADMLTLEDELERTRAERDNAQGSSVDQTAWKPVLVQVFRHGVSSFERVLALEFKKILISVRAKTENWADDKLKSARVHLEKEIQRILEPKPQELDSVLAKANQNSESVKQLVRDALGKQGSSLKGSMDAVKQRISEVLLSVKESLKDKYAKQISDLQLQVKQAERLQVRQNSSQVKEIKQVSKRDDDWPLLAIGVLLIVQIAQLCTNASNAGYQGVANYKELLNVLFRVVAGFRESTHAVYLLKMLHQEVKDGGAWSQISHGHVDTQRLVAAIEAVMKEETSQQLTEQQRLNLRHVLSEHFRLSEALKNVMHVAPEFDQTIREDYDQPSPVDRLAPVDQEEDGGATKRILEPEVLRPGAPQASYKDTTSVQPDDNESVNLDQMTQDQAVSLLTKVFQRLNLTGAANQNEKTAGTMGQWISGPPDSLNQTAHTQHILGNLYPPSNAPQVYASQNMSQSKMQRRPDTVANFAPKMLRSQEAIVRPPTSTRSVPAGIPNNFTLETGELNMGLDGSVNYEEPVASQEDCIRQAEMLVKMFGDNPNNSSVAEMAANNMNQMAQPMNRLDVSRKSANMPLQVKQELRSLDVVSQASQSRDPQAEQSMLENLRTRMIQKQKNNSMMLSKPEETFNSAQDYYKYHKKQRKMHGNQEDISLDRYDQLLSPISTSQKAQRQSGFDFEKPGSLQRVNSNSNLSMQRSGSLKRENSSNQARFQTMEHRTLEARSMQHRPNLPRAEKFATLQGRSKPTTDHQRYGDDFDEYVEPPYDEDERASQRETIQVYASQEVAMRKSGQSSYAWRRQQAKPPKQIGGEPQPEDDGHSMRSFPLKHKPANRASGRYEASRMQEAARTDSDEDADLGNQYKPERN